MTLPLTIPWDDALRYMILAGLAISAIAFLWLIAAAFRTRWTWGLACLLLPPLVLVFVARHRARAWKPALLLALGLTLAAFPPLYTRFAPVDLGPRERVVDGERHITLTGWDRKDYSFLRAKPDVVVLQMANRDVTDATLELLRPLVKLRELDLNGSAVTDSGLAVLRDLPGLEVLRLKDTKITEAGFASALADKPSLRRLDLTGTAVSRDAVRAWKSAGSKRQALQ